MKLNDRDWYRIGFLAATIAVISEVVSLFFYNICTRLTSPLASLLLFIIVGALIVVVISVVLLLFKNERYNAIKLFVVLFVIILVVALDNTRFSMGCEGGRLFDICVFQPVLQCSSFKLSAVGDTTSITIMNGYQQEISITNATCQTQGFGGMWTQYSTPITILAQQSAKLTIDNLYDGSGSKLYFNDGDIFSGKCVVEFYFVSEGPGRVRRNTADVRFTAKP